MESWTELEKEFSALAEPLRFARLDRQWGSDLRIWRLARQSDAAVRKRFLLLADLAGRRLSRMAGRVLPADAAAEEEGPKEVWFRAMWELEGPHEAPMVGSLQNEGKHVGHIFVGRIEKPAQVAANLALRLFGHEEEQLVREAADTEAAGPVARPPNKILAWLEKERHERGWLWAAVATVIGLLLGLLAL